MAKIIKPLQLGLILSLGCLSGVAQAGFTTFSAAGANAAAITSTVSSFRTALGTLNANDGTHQTSGRREINWDAVPDASADPNLFPGDFFNSTTVGGRARGVLLTTPGTGFAVSADSSNPTNTPIGFGFPTEYIAFSAERLFTPIGSTITNVTFSVPGTNTPATISGFGAVFSEATVEGDSKIEFFNALGASLFSNTVPISGASGLSFLGITANASERIARVQITSGANSFIANGNFPGTSTTVMDDFIYSEPVPEPTAMLLLGSAIAGFSVFKRRKLQA